MIKASYRILLMSVESVGGNYVDTCWMNECDINAFVLSCVSCLGFVRVQMFHVMLIPFLDSLNHMIHYVIIYVCWLKIVSQTLWWKALNKIKHNIYSYINISHIYF